MRRIRLPIYFPVKYIIGYHFGELSNDYSGEETFPELYDFAQIVRARFFLFFVGFCGFFRH